MSDTSHRIAQPRGLLIAVFAALLLAGCANSSRNTYSSSDVGRVIETSQGRVISSRPVQIQGDESSGTGVLVGGAAGGAVGYAAGSSADTRLLGTVIGALIGAGAGYLIEDEVRSGQGIEYVVELEDGRVVTIVQNRETNEQAIRDGEPVLVQFGSTYTRIIPQSTAGTTPASGGGSWSNPDESGTAASTGGTTGTGSGGWSEPTGTSASQPASGAAAATGGSGDPESGGYVRYSEILENQDNASNNQ